MTKFTFFRRKQKWFAKCSKLHDFWMLWSVSNSCVTDIGHHIKPCIIANYSILWLRRPIRIESHPTRSSCDRMQLIFGWIRMRKWFTLNKYKETRASWRLDNNINAFLTIAKAITGSHTCENRNIASYVYIWLKYNRSSTTLSRMHYRSSRLPPIFSLFRHAQYIYLLNEHEKNGSVIVWATPRQQHRWWECRGSSLPRKSHIKKLENRNFRFRWIEFR